MRQWLTSSTFSHHNLFRNNVKDIISKSFSCMWYCNHQRANNSNSSFMGTIFKKSIHLNADLVNNLEDILFDQQFEMMSITS